MTLKTHKTKPFKILTMSENTNAFGLRGVVLVAEDGESWEAGGSYLRVRDWAVGTVVNVPHNGLAATFAPIGLEIPRRLAKAPTTVVQALWEQPRCLGCGD